MMTEHSALMTRIDDATTRLVAAVGGLSDDDVRQASLLQGWTRGHVLTHVARTGDAMRNLLTWARTGVETPAYAGQEARNAAIEAGAGRSAATMLADIRGSADAFAAEAENLPDAAWHVDVWVVTGAPFPAEQLLVRRLVEVELHHTDLGIGYRPSDWPAAFAAMDLPEPMRTQRADRLSW